MQDDGLPPGGPLQLAWIKVSGPGQVTFAPAGAATTVATFSEVDTYVIQLDATDGELTSAGQLTVNVLPHNDAPLVSGPGAVTFASGLRFQSLDGDPAREERDRRLTERK